MPHFKPSDNLQYGWFSRFAAALLLAGQVLVHLLKGRIPRYRNVIEHMAMVGPDSLMVVLLTSGFAGMIFTLQMGREFSRLGLTNFVGGIFALAFCRELAPILTASIVAGQVGSAFAAEIGAMRVTEQIDALNMLRTDPVDYLVVPRVVACCVMLPILTVLALIAGIAGGMFVASVLYNLPPSVFLHSVQSFLGLWDLVTVTIKAFVFGAVVAVVSCSWGLTTEGGAKGVSASATAAVVTSWGCIFIVDFFLTLVMFQGFSIN